MKSNGELKLPGKSLIADIICLARYLTPEGLDGSLILSCETHVACCLDCEVNANELGQSGMLLCTK